MSYYIKSLESPIDKKNIWADDILERKSVADKFTNLIRSIQGSCVISINSPYGSGKSFFLNRWYRSLDNDFVSLYFNAWNTDFYEHALIPFVSSLIQQMRENSILGKDDSLLNKLENVGGKIGASIALNLVSKATLDLIKPDELKESLESLQNYENTKYFDNYKERLRNLNEFKNILSELIHELKQKNQKLVIFVDELERCRPTFAVELLETIKHVFEVSGIIFVLALDRSQLEHTVKNLYGSGINADGYLRRFIDIEMRLPKPQIIPYVKSLYDFHKLNEIVKFDNSYYSGGETLVTYMTIWSNVFRLSLREIEQCFAQLNIVIRTMLQGYSFLPVLLSFLVCVKCREPQFYTKIGTDTVEKELQEIDKLFAPFEFEADSKRIIKIFYCVSIDTYEEEYITKRFNEINFALGDSGAKLSNDDYAFFAEAMEIRKTLIYDRGFDHHQKIILTLKKYLELT